MKDPDTIYARWLAGSLSKEEEDALKASGEWQELQAIIDATDDLVLPVYNKDMAFKLIQEKNQKKTMSIRPLWTSVGIAASILLAIGLYTILKADLVAFSAEAKTTFSYQLPDASTFILNDGSSISYDAKSYSKNRVLNLQGEAFFNVQKGSSFVVKSERGNVKVLGTSFNVRTWDDVIEVECYTGSVKVETEGSSLILEAGEGTQRQLDGSWTKVPLKNQRPDWQDEISDFRSTDVLRVFEEMERQFAVSIRYDGPSQRFSGAFTHSNIETALQQVCIPLGLSFSEEETDMYLVQ
jgi:ferric-dicitrate binding protein FerR (iron transport regulator)